MNTNPPTMNPAPYSALFSLPQGVREVLAMHEALGRLGFDRDDIFTGYQDGNAVVVLRAQDHEFAAVFTLPGHDRDSYRTLWDEAVTLWNAALAAERGALLDGSVVFAQTPILIFSLLQQGFTFPGPEGEKCGSCSSCPLNPDAEGHDRLHCADNCEPHPAGDTMDKILSEITEECNGSSNPITALAAWAPVIRALQTIAEHGARLCCGGLDGRGDHRHVYFHGKRWECEYPPEAGGDVSSTWVEMGVSLYPALPARGEPTGERWAAVYRIEADDSVSVIKLRGPDGVELDLREDPTAGPEELRCWLALFDRGSNVPEHLSAAWLRDYTGEDARQGDTDPHVRNVEHYTAPDGSHQVRIDLDIAVARETGETEPGHAQCYWIFDSDNHTESFDYGECIPFPEGDDAGAWGDWWERVDIELMRAAEAAYDSDVLSCPECGNHYHVEHGCCEPDAEEE